MWKFGLIKFDFKNSKLIRRNITPIYCKQNNKTMIYLGIFSVFIGTFGFLSPAYAMIFVLSDHSSSENWYFIEHGATVVADGSLDPYKNNHVRDNLAVTFTSSGGQTPLSLTFIEDASDNGLFRYSKYIMLSASSTDQNVPRVQTAVGNTVTISAPGATSKVITINSQSWGSITSNPNQPSFTTVITCNTQGDTDSDGICDSFETASGLSIPYNGITYTYPCDPSCPVVGTKDIYVEIDWLKHHSPNQAAITSVKNAFSGRGIVLHTQIDEEIPYHKDQIVGPDQGQGVVTEYDTIKNAYFGTTTDRGHLNGDWLTAKRQVFHYTLFAHRLTTGYTGVGETPGQDVVLALGSLAGGYGTQDDQAGSFMHELGHNLNLGHGGNPTSTDNCKPNYLSVMSYSRQLSTYIPNRPLDYSDGSSIPLDETALVESNGIGTGDAGVKTVFGPTPITTGTSGGWIDWNKSGALNSGTLPSAIDLNNFGSGTSCQGSGSSYSDYNDWGNLVYNIRSSSSFWDGVPEFDNNGNSFNYSSSDYPPPENTLVPAEASIFAVPPENVEAYNISIVPIDFTTQIEMMEGQEESKPCNCTDKYLKPKNLTGEDTDKYKYSFTDVSLPEELTKDKIIEMRSSRISSVETIINNYPPCTFTSQDNLENPDKCEETAKNVRSELISDLQAIDKMIRNDELDGTEKNLIEFRDKIGGAGNYKVPLIVNPIARAELVGTVDSIVQSTTFASQAPQDTKYQSLSDLIVSQQIPDWIWYLIIGLLLIIIAIAVLASYEFRNRGKPKGPHDDVNAGGEAGVETNSTIKPKEKSVIRVERGSIEVYGPIFVPDYVEKQK